MTPTSAPEATLTVTPGSAITPTSAVAAPPTATAPPAATANLTATETSVPTATPTATASPTPAPVKIDLPNAGSGGGVLSGQHVGFLGIVFADANYNANPSTGRISINAYIPTLGSGEQPTATGWLDRTFSVPSALGSNVEAQISGDVSWTGTLAGNGVAGAGAEIKIVLKLMEGSRLVSQTTVHTREVRETGLSVGGLRDTGSESVSLSATLTGGSSYTLRLEAYCEATSGVTSASTHCIFGVSNLYADGYISWDGFTVLLLP